MKKFFLTFLLTLAACNSDDSIHYVSDKPPSDLPKNYGYMVGTFTSAEADLKRKLYYSGMALEGSISDDNNFSSLKNHTFVHALPAGGYDFEDYKVSTGIFSDIKPRYKFRLPFNIQAGKVVYIGNIHARTISEPGIFGGHDVIFSFNDHAQSDIPLLLSTYPFLKRDAVTVGIPRSNSSIANIELPK